MSFNPVPDRRPAIRSGEESVFCSTALQRRGLISASAVHPFGNFSAGLTRNLTHT
jgi:hypothetical protein